MMLTIVVCFWGRRAHFEQHVVEWLADPKGSDALA